MVRCVSAGLGALILLGCSPAEAGPDQAANAAAPQEGLRDAATAHVMVDLPDGPLTSPLTIRGEVSGGFFNEGVFPVRLLGPNGDVIAEWFAQPGKEGWMIEDPVPFSVTLTFDVTVETEALLVFQQDIAGEDRLPALDVRRLVMLAPTAR